jgi:arylsulfatase
VDLQQTVEASFVELADGELRIAPRADRVTLLVPAGGLWRLEIEGRVRVAGADRGAPGEASEVARVIEHWGAVENLERVPPEVWTRHSTERIRAGAADRSGWSRFQLAMVTAARTRSIELQLLAQGQEPGLPVSFDDITITSRRLGTGEVCDLLATRYEAVDQRGLIPPWLVRPDLPLPGSEGAERRDAILLPAGSSLVVPVRVPEHSARPVLRFSVGLLPEAVGGAAHDLTIRAEFRDARQGPFPLGSVQVPGDDVDPWSEVRLSLDEVAGHAGELLFSARLAAGSEETEGVAAALLATPLIEPAEAPPESLNVLLVGVDTLRPDHLSAYGYQRPTTPHLEDLAQHGILFTEARSQAPWTLPSFASILTSHYPSSHGAGLGGRGHWTPLRTDLPALAEVVGSAGWETVGVVSNTFLEPKYGLDRGFQSYRWQPSSESASRDAMVVADFVRRHRVTPWLLFWHIMDPHLPYDSPPEQLTRFADPEYHGRFAAEGMVPYGAVAGRDRSAGESACGPPPMPDLSAPDRRFVNDCYDAEVAETDAAVGAVLQALRDSGQWQRTLVVVTADHGEGLGDHGHYHHGYTLFDDQVRVPLIIRRPGDREGRVVERLAGGIDILPTIVGALGLDPPPGGQGIDLLADSRARRDGLVLELPSYDSSPLKAVVASGFKYLSDPQEPARALFDLGSDPGERLDVAARHPELVARFEQALDLHRWQQSQPRHFHLAVAGTRAHQLHLELETSGRFDSNVALSVPCDVVALDDERGRIVVDAIPQSDVVELVFWFLGSTVEITGSLDGQPLVLDVPGRASVATPATVARESIPWLLEPAPQPPARHAELWFVGARRPSTAVTLDPGELERLRALGYLAAGGPGRR